MQPAAVRIGSSLPVAALFAGSALVGYAAARLPATKHFAEAWFKRS